MLTVVATDVTGDGYPDLYIACDSTPSLLYVNRADGTFEEQGLLAGVALNADGQEQGGMRKPWPITMATAGWTSAKRISVTTCRTCTATTGTDRSTTACFSQGSARTCSTSAGASISDVDHDGLRDLLMVNGHVYPEAERLPGNQYRQPRQLYWNVGGRFKEISGTAGPGIREAWSSRGSAAGDLDNDGSLEIVVSNMGNRPSLLKNLGARKNWLLLRCVASGPIAMRSEPW